MEGRKWVDKHAYLPYHSSEMSSGRICSSFTDRIIFKFVGSVSVASYVSLQKKKKRNINIRKGRQYLDRGGINKKECRHTLDRILRNPVNLLRRLHTRQHLKYKVR